MPTRQLLQTISDNSGQSTTTTTSKSSSGDKGLILGLAIGGGAGFLIFLVAFLLVLYRWLRSSRTSPYEVGSSVKLHKFSYRELKNATDNFSPAQRLGQGGFGVVFKGSLRNGKDIAVKKLDTSSLQGEREFQNEVSVIGRVNSPHVVGLLGYCVDGKKRLLVYEYMENGSLQEALFDEMYAASLDWETRFKIILDTARGLAFLHYKCDPPIIHGDVKPSNILLDKHFAARIADFGLARLKSEETAVRSEELEREHIERERLRYERMERDRARRAMRRREREDAERKRSLDAKSSPETPEKRWEGAATHEKSPLGRTDDGHAASNKDNEFSKGLSIEASSPNEFAKGVEVSSPAPSSIQDSFVPEEPQDYPASQRSSPTDEKEQQQHHHQTQVEIDISGPSVAHSPLSTVVSPSTLQSSPSIRQDSPITDISPQHREIGDASEAGSPVVILHCKDDDEKAKEGKEDDVVFQVPDPSVKEETEPEGWSTISPSEGYRDDVSVESGRSGKEVHHQSSKRPWSRDWWWRQDTNSGELTIKDFINWTPTKSVGSSESRRRSASKDWVENSDELTLHSQSRRLDKKKAAELKRQGSRSSVGSEGWGEFSGEIAGKKKEDKQNNPQRGKDRYTMREWWKEGNSGELKSKHSKNKSRDSSSSRVGKTKSREWWRDESGDLGKVPKSGPLLGLTRDGSRREKNRSREWWREEHSEDLTRTNSNRHSGPLKRDGAGRREKSRSRDWFSGDLLGRAAVTSTPSMRGTICYVAPEYGGGGILNEKSDVYSFGVLMLVIISGRRPLQVMASPIVEFERANLISWARHLAQSGNVLDLVDGMLQGQFSKEQANLCITVALLCLQRLPAVRPTMGEVVKILLGESDLPSLPFEFSPSPPYFVSRRKPSAERIPVPSTPSVTSEVPLLA